MMNSVTIFLLISSVVCSTARAVFSKKLGVLNGSKYGFYITQTVLFAVAAAMILVLNFKSIGCPSVTAVILAVAYGIFTVSSQWTYTIALTKAPVSVCAMVYSFGFIIPTVFGTAVWHEQVNAFKIISILLCICTIILTSVKKDDNSKKMYRLPFSLIVAMLSSGGLGVVQKLQQKTAARSETGVFLFLAFVLAAFLSLAASFTKREKATQKICIDSALAFYIFIVGVSMAVANTANTILAGLLPSAVVFPIVNVGVILASLEVSVIILRERISKSQIAAFALGITAILLFNL